MAVGPFWDQATHLGTVMDEAILASIVLSSNQLILFCLAVVFDWLSSLTQVTWPIMAYVNDLRPATSILKCLQLSEFIAIPFTGSEVIRTTGWMFSQIPLHTTSHLLSSCLLIRTIPYVLTVRAGGYLLENRNSTWPLAESAHIHSAENLFNYVLFPW